ncbi:LPXTG cell wall anchor domain-containing protein, partial [Corynebacterium sp. CCM 9203]|uniref:LPXTG cell wall anchor domain-containing protein n=1 Tax=Corynebacterium sp. CCM 9203 TaxID=3057615 RepID=UPI0035233BA5
VDVDSADGGPATTDGSSDGIFDNINLSDGGLVLGLLGAALLVPLVPVAVVLGLVGNSASSGTAASDAGFANTGETETRTQGDNAEGRTEQGTTTQPKREGTLAATGADVLLPVLAGLILLLIGAAIVASKRKRN